MTDRDAGAPRVSGCPRPVTLRPTEGVNMFKTIWSYVNDERGVETLEWIVVGALIVAVGIAVYTGALQGQLITAVNAIGGQITGLASS
jgi:Flp pilus assembly pilin Flp